MIPIFSHLKIQETRLELTPMKKDSLSSFWQSTLMTFLCFYVVVLKSNLIKTLFTFFVFSYYYNEPFLHWLFWGFYINCKIDVAPTDVKKSK